MVTELIVALVFLLVFGFVIYILCCIIDNVTLQRKNEEKKKTALNRKNKMLKFEDDGDRIKFFSVEENIDNEILFDH